MNPKYGSLMDEGTRRNQATKDPEPHSDVEQGKHIRRELLLKQEVGYEHPAKSTDHCSQCAHFKSPHSCEIVAGHIRREDWCRRFKEKT